MHEEHRIPDTGSLNINPYFTVLKRNVVFEFINQAIVRDYSRTRIHEKMIEDTEDI